MSVCFLDIRLFTCTHFVKIYVPVVCTHYNTYLTSCAHYYQYSFTCTHSYVINIYVPVRIVVHTRRHNELRLELHSAVSLHTGTQQSVGAPLIISNKIFYYFIRIHFCFMRIRILDVFHFNRIGIIVRFQIMQTRVLYPFHITRIRILYPFHFRWIWILDSYWNKGISLFVSYKYSFQKTKK